MITFLIFFAGCLTPLPLYYFLLRKAKKKFLSQLESMEDMCYEELASLITRMNHEGPIPTGSSASGLLNLTLLAMSKTIILLEKYAKEKGWNLQIPISDLRGIVMVELSWLKNELDKYLESKRNILKQYHIERNDNNTSN